MGLARGALKLLVAAGSAGALYAVSVVIKRRRVVRAVRRQPKVEFHAHLHGSIRLATLVEERMALEEGAVRDLTIATALMRAESHAIEADGDGVALAADLLEGERVCEKRRKRRR